MRQIDRLTSSSSQNLTTFTIDDGLPISLGFRFLETQNSWIANIGYNEFQLNGYNVVLSPNLLNQFSRLLPFGLAIISDDGYDPYYLDDFETGRVGVYLLSRAEKENVSSIIG